MLSRNSIKIGRLFGIDIGINLNWFIIFFIMVISFSRYVREEYNLPATNATGFAVLTTLLLFASVLAHEFGHALTARSFGINTRKIILHLFGGVAFLESEPRRPAHEFWIAIAGPAVSILLAIIFGSLYFLIGDHLSQMPQILLVHLTGLNLLLGIFNCVPGFPLDGGRVVRAAIWAATGDFLKATRIASYGGVAFGAILIMWGVYSLSGGWEMAAPALFRMLLGAFVIYLARISSRQAEVTSAFHGMTVRDIMRPVRAVVPANARLSEVIGSYLRPLGTDQLPVVDGDRLLGYIGAEEIQRVPERQWDWMTARELVRPYEAESGLDPQAEALTALERLSINNKMEMPVFQNRRLLGFITRVDILNILRQPKKGGVV